MHKVYYDLFAANILVYQCSFNKTALNSMPPIYRNRKKQMCIKYIGAKIWNSIKIEKTMEIV